MRLELRSEPREASSALMVRVNGQPLTNATTSGEWAEFGIGAPPICQGRNNVAVALSAGEATLDTLRLWARCG